MECGGFFSCDCPGRTPSLTQFQLGLVQPSVTAIDGWTLPLLFRKSVPKDSSQLHATPYTVVFLRYFKDYYEGDYIQSMAFYRVYRW